METLKCINHGEKMTKLLQPDVPLFHEVLVASGLKDVSRSDFNSSIIHVSIVEMSITLVMYFVFLHMPKEANY